MHVPNGAKITTIVIDGCDEASNGGIVFALYRSTSAGTDILATADTGTPDTPGCSVFAADLAVPETADFDAYRYWIAGGNQTADGLTRLGAVRVLYSSR